MTSRYAITYVEIDAGAFDDTYTKILLHMDGADASTVFTDDNFSGALRVWTPAGNAQIDTAQSKFGGASGLFDGTGDQITTPDHPDFSLGNSDFTIDCWIRSALDGTALTIAGQTDASVTAAGSAWALQKTSGNNINFFWSDGVNTFGITTSSTVLAGAFHHVAVVRSGNTITTYVDGMAGASSPFSGSINDSNQLFGVGALGGFITLPWNGWIDEFRLSVGIARWTSNFTPPAAPYAAGPGTTYRFAVDNDFLTQDIPSIPSLKEVKISPATVSLGKDLGQRASVTATFRDHRYRFLAEQFYTGTFWGKFRARYGLKLRGHPLRVIRGQAGQSLADMETRHFVIDSADGPNSSGEYKLIAKDVLKFADGDRAQAPVLSNGSLLADITSGATTATLTPTGIGDAEYPASGILAIGGSEICTFTRAGDVLTLTRAQFNTAAQAHTAGDRVQLCLRYNGIDIAVIVQDLLITYCDVPSSYISITDWTAETAAYLGVVYTALIAEPTDVDQLLSEIIEQAALALWWDDINQKIRLQVLRPVGTLPAPGGYNMENILRDSFEINEQADKRISQCYVYFGKINALVKEDQIDNYRSTVSVIDPPSEVAYGSPAIKKIFSRWIPAGGRITAQTAANKQLGRFRDPPRRFKFDLLRDAQPDPQLGSGCLINFWQLQDSFGNNPNVPAQIYRLTPDADQFEVEAEEMLWTPFGTDVNPSARTIVFDANENDVNLRTRHDQLYPLPVSGNSISAIIYSGITIGASSASVRAFDIGTWPAGVTVSLIVLGRIEGHGGDGGHGGVGFTAGVAGGVGGIALYTRQAITLTDASGRIWGGGGGGGGGGSGTSGFGGAGGGGGAGTEPGIGGAPGQFLLAGSDGTADAGGAGGPGYAPNSAGGGGAGGGPGLDGTAGVNGAASTGGAKGTAGAAIDGISFVTTSGSPGDRRGGQIN